MKKVSRETIGVSIIFLSVMAVIQWLLLGLTHWSIAMIVPGVLTFIVVCYVVALSHATPNGGSKGPDVSKFIIPLRWFEGFLLCSLWLISYLMNKPLPNMVIIIPLGLLLAFGIGQRMYNYVKSASFWYKNYSLCKLEIEDKTNSRSTIAYIKFSSSTKYSMDINPNTKQRPTTYIPRNMNKIVFRFRPKESNSSEICEFPFDYSLCQEKKSSKLSWLFWISQRTILPIKLTLLPNNKIDLYIDNHLVQHYELVTGDILT